MKNETKPKPKKPPVKHLHPSKGAAHSPAPWIASCDDEDSEEANVIRSADGAVIARYEDAPEIRHRFNKGQIEPPGSCAACDTMDEADANGRLMAAAPALLEACKELMRTREEYDRVRGCATREANYEAADAYDEAVSAAEAAIEKAEGRP